MARTYAKVRIDIWADDDFRQLTDPAQALYFRLMTSPTLSLAGVADWRPTRLAHLTRGMTTQQLNNAASELAEALYVVVDEDTEEILLRSFIRHDGIMKYPNIATSMLKDYAAIFSPTLKGVVVHELRRLHEEDPDMAGWKVIGERLDDRAINPNELTPFNGSNSVPEQFDSGSNSVPEQFDSGSANGYPNGSVNGSYIPQPSTLNPQPTTLIPSESPDGDPRTRKRNIERATSATRPDDDPAFLAFWAHYPRKDDRLKAFKAWNTALKVTDAETLTKAAKAYSVEVAGREKKYIKLGSSWLSAGSWENEPASPSMLVSEQPRERDPYAWMDRQAGERGA